MTGWQCNLCSHIYDEKKEATQWEDLPEDWVCPICGSPKSSFTQLKAVEHPLKPLFENKDVEFEKWECGLCSFVYDEEKESIPWGDLASDWVCPVCGSGKTSFASVMFPAINLLRLHKLRIADEKRQIYYDMEEY